MPIMPKLLNLFGVEDTAMQVSDHAPYYAITAKTGTLVTRDGRPVYATYAEWRDSMSPSFAIHQLIPATPLLYGSVPLFNDVCPCGAKQRQAYYGHAEGCGTHAAQLSMPDSSEQ
jgi:hypothetical protein